ncbi:MAG TPA: XdhC/CoxI family protein [Parafilimonas sp.]|nr:XdhC/CoxI family protein [Parafilimonas sp.]
MKEIRDIIKAFEEAQRLGKQTALATVVHVEGSSYRRPGARMLITEDGQLTGMISGGCLEGDALRKALLVMMEKKSKLVTYDTMDDDDAKFGVGLGCNGIIQVLIEPISSDDPNNPIAFLKAIDEKRQKTVLVTLFSLESKKDPQYGTCLLLQEDKAIVGSPPILQEILIADANDALLNEVSSFKNYVSKDYAVTAFIEAISPPVALVIIGAGNDVIPLVRMAEILGWEVTVTDGRPDLANNERFSTSCQVLVSNPESALEKINIDQQTVFVLMTHNYNYDKVLLSQLVKKDLRYIGMLGPKKKLQRMLGELKEEGVVVTEEQLSVVHSPVGLDIGAETAEEIAVSILAEIKAAFSGRNLQPLRNKEMIHPRASTVIEEVKISKT